MKNNTLSGRYCFKNPRFKQIFRIMRISTFLLMVCVFCSYAGNAHSQNAKVSIHMNNVKLDKILNEIENQTDYLFIYNNQVDKYWTEFCQGPVSTMNWKVHTLF